MGFEWSRHSNRSLRPKLRHLAKLVIWIVRLLNPGKFSLARIHSSQRQWVEVKSQPRYCAPSVKSHLFPLLVVIYAVNHLKSQMEDFNARLPQSTTTIHDQFLVQRHHILLLPLLLHQQLLLFPLEEWPKFANATVITLTLCSHCQIEVWWLMTEALQSPHVNGLVNLATLVRA